MRECDDNSSDNTGDNSGSDRMRNGNYDPTDATTERELLALAEKGTQQWISKGVFCVVFTGRYAVRPL